MSKLLTQLIFGASQHPKRKTIDCETFQKITPSFPVRLCNDYLHTRDFPQQHGKTITEKQPNYNCFFPHSPIINPGGVNKKNSPTKLLMCTTQKPPTNNLPPTGTIVDCLQEYRSCCSQRRFSPTGREFSAGVFMRTERHTCAKTRVPLPSRRSWPMDERLWAGPTIRPFSVCACVCAGNFIIDLNQATAHRKNNALL